MEAGRSCDAYGLFKGNKTQQADAKRAYPQTYLTNTQGISTYVLLSEDQWDLQVYLWCVTFPCETPIVQVRIYLPERRMLQQAIFHNHLQKIIH